jgi:hypothetical protein
MLCDTVNRLMWPIVVQDGAVRVCVELSGDRGRLGGNATKGRRGWI